MTFRKSLVFLMVIALVVVMTVGGLAAEKQITLTVLNYFDASAPGAAEGLQIWADFAKANPDIKVEREDVFGEPFHQKTEAYAAANMLPDVIYMWPGGRSTTLQTKKLVKDLRPLLGEEFLSEFQDAALAPQAGGYLAELPFALTSSHCLYVNEKLLADLGLSMPKTYKELKDMVPKLKAAGKECIVMGAMDDWVMQSCLFSMVVGRLVGDAGVDKLLAGEAKFTDKPFVSTLEFIQTMYKDGVLAKANLQTPYGDVIPLFATGQAPFMIDGDWRQGAFVTDQSTGIAVIPVEEQKHIRMTVLPAIPGEINKNTTSGVVGCGFGISANIKAEKLDAALRLVKYMASPEVQRRNVVTGAGYPSRKGIVVEGLDPLGEDRVKFYGRFSASTYVMDNVFVADVYTPMNIGMQEIGFGMTTPKKVAENVQKAFDAWVKAGRK